VQRVRSTLGPGVIATHPDGYSLAAEVVVDAETFEREARAAASALSLRAALARWKGEPYADLGEWEPAELERTRLSELRDQALETCLALEAEAGVAADSVAELEAMVADKPLRERRWFLLMTALYRAGRVADALRTYQRARKVFAAELGIDPGPELRNLEEQILLADVRGASPGNLPRPLTSFVGRAREVEQLADLVRERSLVTLSGVGGVGKTRLALATAAKVVTDFGDGAWLCDLAPLTDPSGLWHSLAASLGVQPSPGRNPDDVILGYLAAKRLVLVLDNCEHLLSEVSRVAGAIVQNCPGVAVLATSRERLAVPGEKVIAVSPLPVPPVDATIDALARCDAVQLFCERALDADHTFTLSARNAHAVAQLCRHLDGLPLAIELAAARVRSLSPGDLLARIDDRFQLLTKGSRSTPERHQRLRYTIDWSYNLLSDPAQQALKAMSVFAGGCDLVSAEAVLGGEGLEQPDVADRLDELVDKSLVEVDATDGWGRYRLLETIRQYARERLEADGEATSARARHLARYIDLAEEAGPHLRGRDGLEWAAVLARETDNFRAALHWAVEAELADEGLRLVVPLTVTPTYLPDWVELAISIPGASQHPLYPLATATAATNSALRVDLERAGKLVAVAHDAQIRLNTHYPQVPMAAGVYALIQGNLGQAQHEAQVCVDMARAAQDPFDLSAALTIRSTTRLLDSKEATVDAQEALQIARQVESPSRLLHALFTLSLAIVHEQPTRACALIDEAAEVARKLGDRWALATADAYRARVALVQEDWPTALRAATDAAEQDIQLGGSVPLGSTFIMGSIALARLQLLESAAVLVGVIEARFPFPAIDPEWQRLFAVSCRLMLDTLGVSRTAELKADGAFLTIADGVAFLRSECDRFERGSG
jgi:predicted ATPase/DNA-binding SARP family transcriptional activator